MGGSPLAGLAGDKKRKKEENVAGYTGAAAKEREAEARKQKKEGLAYINNMGNRAIDASVSIDELNTLSKQVQNADKIIARDEALIAAVDPALMEASKQALALLKGESAASNTPISAQRAADRQKLVNSLRAQYGPGAESSSIGQNALQKFDMETSTFLANNQQNTLSSLLGVTQNARSMGMQGQGQGLTSLGAASAGFGSAASRKAGTMQNVSNIYSSFVQGANANILGAAGSQYVDQILKNQAGARYYGEFQDRASADHDKMMGMFSQFGGAMAGSDVAFKEHIEDVSPADLQELLYLKPVEWSYKDPETHGTGRHVGFIAQEVEKTKLGKYCVVTKDDGKYIDYGKLLPMLCAAYATAGKEFRDLMAEVGK